MRKRVYVVIEKPHKLTRSDMAYGRDAWIYIFSFFVVAFVSLHSDICMCLEHSQKNEQEKEKLSLACSNGMRAVLLLYYRILFVCLVAK